MRGEAAGWVEAPEERETRRRDTETVGHRDQWSTYGHTSDMALASLPHTLAQYGDDSKQDG